jgi:FxsC-like protein
VHDDDVPTGNALVALVLAGQRHGGGMPYFFLSYARVDGDGYLEKFYADLCEAVRLRTGHRIDDIGFRDESDLELGVNWPTRLVDALGSARVFVAVCSPSYFASEMCGKEWQTFLHVSEARRPGSSEGTLLPITWTPTAALPEVARRLQSTNVVYGSTYSREGLHFLVKLRRFRDEYELFVSRLAEQIARLGEAKAATAPPIATSFERTPSAFVPTQRFGSVDGLPATRQPGAGPLDFPSLQPGHGLASAASGPRHVNFVVVAAPKRDIEAVRQDTRFYGATAYDWAPYRPRSGQRLCVFAQSVASAKDLTSALSTAERSILDLLAKARENNEIVVLLVDVWTTRLEPYQRVLIEYDDRNAPTSAVMVPWSDADEELTERSAELEADLRRALPHNVARRDTVFRPAIPSYEDFKIALEEVLAEAQSRVFSYGTVARRAGGNRVIERPMLTPPGESART